MKFFKIIYRDVQIDSHAGFMQFLLSALLFLFLFFSFHFEVFHYFPLDLGSPKNVNQLGLSLGDVILVEIGGSLPRYDATYEQKITFPAAFFLVHILPCCYTLNLAHDDLERGGIQVFTRMGSTNVWWYSKCILNCLVVAWYYFSVFLIWIILCNFTGKSISLQPNADVFTAFFSAYCTEFMPSAELFCCMILLPELVILTLSLCQMTLTLFIKPIFAFMIICLYSILGFYCIHPLFLINYAMPVRNGTLGIYNFNTLFGMSLCLIIDFLAIFIGKHRLYYLDIIGER